MKKAKEQIQEYLADDPKKEQMPREVLLDRAKPEINNMLHMYLPDDITLKEADAISMVIFEMLTNPYSYVRPQN